MPELKDILYKVSLTSSRGNMNVDVKGICSDSRKARQGFLFIAVKGTQMDMTIYQTLLTWVFRLLFVKTYPIISMIKSLMSL
jgi:hypothetical protein